MKSLRHLLILGILLPFTPCQAQFLYNAGAGSGTGGINNVFVGNYAGHVNSGANNSFVGFLAGAFNDSGTGNSFLGSYAGYTNTYGSHNSFLGAFAGYANTYGNLNTFVGNYAGYANTTGSSNSFVGNAAGYANTTGYYNSFVGTEAGKANTTGSGNSFVGYGAGRANSTGEYNNFVGFAAGFGNTTGNFNNFLGVSAGMLNKTGSHNNFMGKYAGYRNTSGANNNFMGTQAGYANTTGGRNTAIGAYAAFNNLTGNRNTVVGDSAAYFATGSSNVYIGSEAGRGSSQATPNSASYNVFMGAKAGYANSSGKENAFLGHNAGYANTAGSYNLFLGSYANSSNGSLSNAGAIGYRAYVTASNALVLGSINGVNGATASTNVGIGTSAPAYNLHVNGTAAKPGTATWTVASDKRLKKNISSFKDGLAILQQVKPVWFEYNGKAGMPTEKRYVGVIAQQMQQIAPYMVGSFTYQDSTGQQETYLDYDANALTYVLVNAVQEQQGQLNEKDARIASLERRMAQLEQLLLKQLPGNTESADVASSQARLWQNEPNPTDGATIIRYYIPQKVTQAQISVYSANGQPLKSYPIPERGEGQVEVETAALTSGVYLYRLVVDGRSIDAKKLVLKK